MKSNRQLEPQQAAAAYELDRHISVTAGPGSGKTTVLVERYLHILKTKKLSIDQIVAITFTNRAANEMRERLRERLNQILQTATGDERRRWLNYKRTLDGAVITTIHGFCARLLREFPVEARIDPQFTLLDEHRAQMLLEVTVEQVLREFLSSNHPEISRLTLGVNRARLADGLARMYREIRSQGLLFADLAAKTAQNHSSEAEYASSLRELELRVGQFLKWPRLSLRAEAKRQRAVEEWPALIASLSKRPAHAALSDYCLAIERFRAHRPDKTAVGDLAPQLDELLWGHVSKRTNDYSGSVPQLCFDLFARDYALEVIALLEQIDQRLNEEKQRLSVLDFDDLESRTLGLLGRPEVIARTSQNYKFFLVDEFQDTNNVQRELLERLALRPNGARANLFIVGDRKQSIYGFRGADVDVFREMTATLIADGGEEKSLQLNFRSQPPLINLFNYLFARLFTPTDELAVTDRTQLGYVEHEPSEAKRETLVDGPLVDFLITAESSGDDDPRLEQTSRELDAEQVAQRIIELTESGDAPPPFSDIALLFRAMTNVGVYESVFRRANIPYQTVLGRGFYEREEVTDLIQLLRFLDNKTDELALAAILRSPLCGISDNALLALRCAPKIDAVNSDDRLRHFNQTRNLFHALKIHRQIAYINDEEHALLDRAADLLERLIARRHNYTIGNLLRYAVEQSEFMAVIAANFDGAQRLANVQRLFTLAERFERSGAHLIRDFVRYVEEFEAIGSRESEGQIDEATNAVRLMTIHQAKGLEFPIVIIPELQRYARVSDHWFMLDRHRGLTLKVPDGRGRLVAGCSFKKFEERQALREQFESMRLLYVAATRAQDRLIFSGTTRDFESLGNKGDTWLKWIWQSLNLPPQPTNGIVDLAPGVQIEVRANLLEKPKRLVAAADLSSASSGTEVDQLSDVFPLLRSVPSEPGGIHRFSVTQLLNHQRCPRQYYFDRILHLPTADQLAVWNDAEAPEPPANLTATLRGAVIHRFCETYQSSDDLRERLKQSLDQVLNMRQSELGDRILEIDKDAAVVELLPLAENYLNSSAFQRVEKARAIHQETLSAWPRSKGGLWSELPFRLRRPLGILNGAIDKLLLLPGAGGIFDIEIIDFKTNRIKEQLLASGRAQEPQSQADAKQKLSESRLDQFAFDFERATTAAAPVTAPLSLEEQVRVVASDYLLQMQAYALAAQELLPELVGTKPRVKVTLHFLDPNVEFQVANELVSADACARAIDAAMRDIVSSHEPAQFPVRPQTHCRTCSFLSICRGGREWLHEHSVATPPRALRRKAEAR